MKNKLEIGPKMTCHSNLMHKAFSKQRNSPQSNAQAEKAVVPKI